MTKRIYYYALPVLLLLATTPAWTSSTANGDFPISSVVSVQRKPTLTYDPNHDRYLATWSEFRDRVTDVDVYGQLMDSQGKLIGKEIPISAVKGGQAVSAISFDNINNRYLVVWADWRNAIDVDSDIYGQFINADGSLYGKNFAISQHRGISQKQPAVAFDPSRQRFLVAWKDGQSGTLYFKLHSRYLDANGKPIGNEFRIANGKGGQDRPSLHYDPKRKRFLVVWRDYFDKDRPFDKDNLGGNAIYTAFVDPERPLNKGDQLQDGYYVDSEEDACLPPSLYAAAYSPEEDAFLVVWTSGREYKKMGLDVYGALIRASDGKRILKPFAISSHHEYQEFPAVAYDAKRKRFLVVWYDLQRGSSAEDIYGRYVTTKGEMSDEFLVTDKNQRGIRMYPALAISPKSDSAIVLWEDGRIRVPNKVSARIFARVRSLD